MSGEHIGEFLDAYLDQELNVIAAAQFDRHLVECDACRATYDRYRATRDSLRGQMHYFRAPKQFEEKLRGQLFPSRLPERVQTSRRWTPVWAIAAGTVLVLLFTALLLQLIRRPSSSDILADQVVSSHIRSLLANHLSDVVSTDQHTVKPWFSGRLDFAPVVKDLSAEGFPLQGGRLDYLDDRTVAALVYKRRQHSINLFLWPSTASDSAFQTSTIKGYNLVHWRRSHMEFWAVSDVNAADLNQFARSLGT